MELVTITDFGSELSSEAYERLEAGNVIFLPRTPIEFSRDDYQFLLSRSQAAKRYHKNIAYRPQRNVLTGAGRGAGADRLKTLIRSFSAQSVRLLSPCWLDTRRTGGLITRASAHLKRKAVRFRSIRGTICSISTPSLLGPPTVTEYCAFS